MAKLIGLKLWVFLAAYLAIGVSIALPWAYTNANSLIPFLGPYSGGFSSYQVVVAIVWFIVATLLFKPVWRWIWGLPIVGPWLSGVVFPDLNGRWKVEVKSNWPIIQRLREAAKEKSVPRFDPTADDVHRPNLQSLNFFAKIDQRWFSTEVVFETNETSPLLTSTTLSVDLLRKEGGEPKRVSWIYKQENSAVPEQTDESAFLGAALLFVAEDGRTLRGKYWTNRSWHKGLNAAGEIILTRVD